MKPYYKDDYCEIWHGDCREILPTLPKCDLLLTDPPYGTGHYNSDVKVMTAKMLKEWVNDGVTAIFGWPENLDYCPDHAPLHQRTQS